MKLADPLKKKLARDGFVVVPGVVPKARVDAALRQINHKLGLAERPRDGYADKLDYLSEYVSTPQILDLVNGSPLRLLADSLLGAGRVERVNQGQVALRFPTPSDDAPAVSSVHIDGLYAETWHTPIERYTFAAGVMLSDVDRENAGNFVAYPGSYRAISGLFRDKGLGALRAGVSKSVALPEPVQVKGKAGDVVLFHYLTAHDKVRNDSPEIRYAVYFRFWHVDAWHDKSEAYLKKNLTEPWAEWAGMRGVDGTQP